jgi:alkylation response protein AidB-like acyl-CoA dehydrogenase
MKRFITPHIYNYAKKIMPKISETEAAALNSGSVSIEGKIFEGKLKTTDLVKNYDIKLNNNEKKFIENETNNLCSMLDNHKIEENQNLSNENWNYIRSNKFMGLVISKQYGGLEFSAHAHAKVVEKIATRNGAAAVSVMVPNSLGPGELLYHYGTKEQKDYYLPRLANGIDVPCFGLTTEHSGSDAASMFDVGVVVKENDVLGIRVSFSKRYITLAPIATLIGLAFKLKDPDNLLTKGKEGITLALIPKEKNIIFPYNTNGIVIGERHNPLNVGFMNGTIVGESVFIPMSSIIGGEEKCGFGWNMLMESLGEGRGISLPALAVATSKLSTFGVGGYARIRKQFNIPIAEMEGVKEKLAVIAKKNYQLVAAQMLFNSILANKEKPPVLSAIMKYQCTEYGRVSINNGMDILGGAAICKGPMNFLASSYTAIPIAITVEGSNTLTRSLIIFGQGLNRSHPYLLNLIKTIQDKNDLDNFHKYLIKLINHTKTNFLNSVYNSMSIKFKTKNDNKIDYYQKHLDRVVSNFALSTNMILLMGGKIKTAEYISGRYADMLSNIYMAYACLWYYEKNKHIKDLDIILDGCMNEHFINIQNALHELSNNIPLPLVGKIIRYSTYPFGKDYNTHNDILTTKISDLITKNTEVRDLLTENVYISNNIDDRLNQIMRGLPLCSKADYIKKISDNKVISYEDNLIIKEAEKLKNEITKVDKFSKLVNTH